MKMGIDFFRDTILKSLGIDFQFVDSGPTELIELSIHSLYMDFTFLTTGGFYIHIEFQTTDGGEPDLRRFHAYEAVFLTKPEEIKEVVAMTRLGQMIFDDGIQQGVQKGLTQGIQQGLTQGIQQGVTQGQTSKNREIVLRMLDKKQFSHEEIADLVGVSVDEVARIAKTSESK